MKKLFPAWLRVDDNTPDFHCPYCKIGLEWNDNLYAFNKEIVKCGECEKIFSITQNIKTTYKIEKYKETK